MTEEMKKLLAVFCPVVSVPVISITEIQNKKIKENKINNVVENTAKEKIMTEEQKKKIEEIYNSYNFDFRFLLIKKDEFIEITISLAKVFNRDITEEEAEKIISINKVISGNTNPINNDIATFWAIVNYFDKGFDKKQEQKKKEATKIEKIINLAEEKYKKDLEELLRNFHDEYVPWALLFHYGDADTIYYWYNPIEMLFGYFVPLSFTLSQMEGKENEFFEFLGNSKDKAAEIIIDITVSLSEIFNKNMTKEEAEKLLFIKNDIEKEDMGAGIPAGLGKFCVFTEEFRKIIEEYYEKDKYEIERVILAIADYFDSKENNNNNNEEENKNFNKENKINNVVENTAKEKIMIAKDYNKYKKEVLDLYNDYVKTFESFGEEVNKRVRKAADKIEKKIFNLMVLGAAKSGKSTFINAYLGEEILPMDVRQCTSAIIKIHYGDKFGLVAKTAAGGQTTINNSDEIIKFLKDNASIDDKYRNIPVPTINNDLLIEYGKQGKEITDKVIENFSNAVVNDNIYNIDIKEYNEAIRNYIKEKASKWGKIITDIDITYKLSEDMKYITIIDSPGIGASGNFGEIAKKYIEEANAIIFVKYLKGQAVDSKQFESLIRGIVGDKQKEFLFLVFNGKSDLSGSEFNSIKEHAINVYKNKNFEEEKIIFVDSKIQLFLNKCLKLKTSEKITEFFEKLEEENNNFESAENCWLKSKGNYKTFIENMEEKSDFQSVNEKINKFARKANYLELKRLLENIKKEYEGYKNRILRPLNLAENNIEDPKKLEKEINEKKKEIDILFGTINKEIDKINEKYLDNIRGEAIIIKLINDIKNEYKKKLEKYKNLPKNQITNETFNEVKKIGKDTIDKIEKNQKDIRDMVIKDCDKELQKHKDSMPDISIEAYIPNFTDTDFDEMKESAKRGSYERAKLLWVIPLWWENYNGKMHLEKLIGNVEVELDKEISEINSNSIAYVDECKDKYQKKLEENRKKLELEYDKLLEDKDNNDKNIAQIESWKKNLSIAEEKNKKIEELKGELESC